MHTLNIRNLDDALYNKIKKESEKKRVSINKLLLNVLKKNFFKTEPGYHDLDQFFGTWSEEEHQNISEALKDSRQIDKELWK